MPYVVHFDEYTPDLRLSLGGKNASLGEMTGAGLSVPPGFAVTTDAFTAHLAGTALAREVKELLSAVDTVDPGALEPISAAVRARVEAWPVAAEVAEEVAVAYDRLCRQCGTDGLPVAVRSSATCEDPPDASFAGEHDTFLWVRRRGEVARHLVRCWSSLCTARAISYRAQTGYADTAVAMSVGVQKMVRPIASGVAFTLNPINGDRSQVAIDANWGLGEPVVCGEVTPDNYLVDKVMWRDHRPDDLGQERRAAASRATP